MSRWRPGRASAALCLLLLGALALPAHAIAHTPVVIDTVLTVAPDGGITVDLTLRQNALLAMLGSDRSLFRAAADLDRQSVRLRALILRDTVIRAPDRIVLACTSLAAASDPADGSLIDPVRIRCVGRLPAAAATLAFVPGYLQDAGFASAVLISCTVSAPGQAAVLRVVRPGEPLNWRWAGTTAGADPTTGAGATPSGFAAFMRLGFHHILPEGTDHILFVLGLFLLSPRLKPLLTQITAFTIAHSLTLGLCMAGLVALPSRIVEPLIALSIAVVAIENIVSRTVHPWRWLIVFAFGLVHGLGFASALKQIHLQGTSILIPLLGFNVGVELGQLTVVAGAALTTAWCWDRSWYTRGVVIPASLAIAAIGLFWAVQRSLGYGIEP